MRESGVVETKTVKRWGKGRDGIWIFLADPAIVDNVSKVDKIAKVAKVEEILSENEETGKSTLPTLDTLPTSPILATMGQDTAQTSQGGEETPPTGGDGSPTTAQAPALEQAPAPEQVPKHDCGSCQVALRGDRTAIKCDPCIFLSREAPA